MKRGKTLATTECTGSTTYTPPAYADGEKTPTNRNMQQGTSMLKTKIISMSLLLLTTCIAAQAQTKKKTTAKKAAVEKTDEQERAEMMYERMLSSTAQLLVIDSAVVDFADFINKIPLNKESGHISTYDAFFKTTGQPSSYVHVNEFGNKAFFSKTDDNGHSRLYMADKLGGKWTGIRELSEFGDEFEDINYPFMMPDGTTLYFSAKGKNGLGGYDIYVTRYDTDSARFYRPENLGLPYNSTGNDYFCLTDDFDELGWLVTDRRQADGKVCIYTFVPSQSRDVYDEELVDEDKLNSLAELRSIQDTWTDDGQIDAARKRQAALLARNNAVAKKAITFIVNDNTVYTSATDFKSPTNRERFAKLQEMKKDADEMAERLTAMRQNYSKGNTAAKNRLGSSIIKAEKSLETLRENIHKLEKEIRNTENMIGN